jgi:hypothetical protein
MSPLKHTCAHARTQRIRHKTQLERLTAKSWGASNVIIYDGLKIACRQELRSKTVLILPSLICRSQPHPFQPRKKLLSSIDRLILDGGRI